MSKLKVLGLFLCLSASAALFTGCADPCQQLEDTLSTCEGAEPFPEDFECTEAKATCFQCMLDNDISCDNVETVMTGCATDCTAMIGEAAAEAAAE